MKIGILGTKWTMAGPVYPGALGRRDLGWATPGEADRKIASLALMDVHGRVARLLMDLAREVGFHTRRIVVPLRPDLFELRGVAQPAHDPPDLLVRAKAKIRDAQLQKVPYMLIAGDRDIEASAVSVRTRQGGSRSAVRRMKSVISVCSMATARMVSSP